MNSTTNQRIWIQVGIWIFIFLGLPFLLTGGQMNEASIYRSFGMLLGVIIIIPLNLKILFPTFYFKQKPLQYLVAALVTLASVALLLVWIRSFFSVSGFIPPNFKNTNNPYLFYFIGHFFPLLMVLLSSALYEITIVANQSAREAAQLKSEKLESELKFLKSQINPHFLFNSLNNIYTLTMLNPKSAGESVLKLSEMLRYLLYECDKEKVLLSRELAYLQNYIDLFLLKDDERLNINFDTTKVSEDIEIAPLLFIPFVENAFKHSQIEDIENGWITIDLLGNNQEVQLNVNNSLPKTEFSKDKVGGIGLQNVKRQLELIYPNQYQLNVNNTNDNYSIELRIELK